MFEEYAGQRILEFFFERPFGQFHLREAARMAHVSAPTAKTQLDKFVKAGLIEKSNKANLSLFRANAKSRRFRFLKIAFSLEKIEKSGLVEEMLEKQSPRALVLFGSAARGEDSGESDLDLLIVAKNRQNIDWGRFEKKVGRSINCIQYTPVEWEKKAGEDKPFYQRVLIEGIVLAGELPVVE